MNARTFLLPLLATAAVVPPAMAAAQSAQPAPAIAVPKADPLAVAPVPPLAPVVPVELPPPFWQASAAGELLAYIRQVGREGLDPRDYDPGKLELALRGGDPTTLARVATDSFNRLARDLALGHVRGAARHQWFVVDKDLEGDRARQLLMQAVTTMRVADTLNSLLPTHPQYWSLKNALTLANPTDALAINKIRLNMDRWRWLPRDLGERYIIVNVPGQAATLVENSQTRWKRRAIAGAVKTPTPQLSVNATGVILNPWWEVPKSIAPSVAGKGGYVAVRGKDGKVQRWRQPPGPGNALGKIKFVMPNDHAIYLHDTNNRGLFDARARFLSHGCIRTEHILDLAAELLSDDAGEWNAARIDETLKSGKTVQANFVKPVPVYIVYFSTAALTDGSLTQYADLYGRDGRVLAALTDRDGGAKSAASAAKTAAK
ncbi:MAG TPA: L,D-transpeptidase family protein [Sphingomicrobium sp.]|nr:L,D-transpeptidase family protein [Sphingomicrobium sp.]